MIRELERVALTTDVRECGLVVRDVGTVVHVYRDGKAYEVEFVTLAGETVAVTTLDATQVRPVGPNEIASARKLEAA